MLSVYVGVKVKPRRVQKELALLSDVLPETEHPRVFVTTLAKGGDRLVVTNKRALAFSISDAKHGPKSKAIKLKVAGKAVGGFQFDKPFFNSQRLQVFDRFVGWVDFGNVACDDVAAVNGALSELSGLLGFGADTEEPARPAAEHQPKPTAYPALAPVDGYLTGTARPAQVSAPEPLLVRSWADAEEVAAAWMRWFGYHDAAVTASGADGGVDVVSSAVIAQVKATMAPVSRPQVQQLAGIASVEQKVALFFSLTSFTREACDWADRAGMALFQFDLAGEPEPVNSHAATVMSSVGRCAGGEQPRTRSGEPRPGGW